MDLLTKKGNAVPYPDGTKLKWKKSGKNAQLINQCNCTSDLLHYAVQTEGESRETFFNHSEIDELFITLPVN